MAGSSRFLGCASTAAQAANTSTSVPVKSQTGDYVAQRQLDQKVDVSAKSIPSKEPVTIRAEQSSAA